MSDLSTPLTLSEHEVVTTRVFDAPRELVWAAWTTPEQLARWWGPRGVTTPLDTITLDLRVGGEFAMTMVNPDGSENRSEGHFQEVVEPQRLVFGGEVLDFPKLAHATTTVTLTDLGDGRTEVVCAHTLIATDDLPAMAQAGWASQFDRLGELLAA
jgi:uncharacterized protein YndB with AHSA1/START domain